MPSIPLTHGLWVELLGWEFEQFHHTFEVARLQALSEPIGPLFGATVGEGLFSNSPSRLLLQNVITDSFGGVNRIADITFFENLF